MNCFAIHPDGMISANDDVVLQLDKVCAPCGIDIDNSAGDRLHCSVTMLAKNWHI
jgi:hypothetical protein